MIEKPNRKLSQAEAKRWHHYEKLTKELQSQGYQDKVILIDVKMANILAALFSILLIVVVASLYLWLYPIRELDITFNFLDSLIFIILVLALTIFHELVHGSTWALFSPRGWSDIEFGFIWKYLTPYCSCKAPLTKRAYIIGGVMPLFIVGLIPIIIGLMHGSILISLLGTVMTAGAVGDLMIVAKILGYKSSRTKQLILDHPTEGGCIIFEKG